MRYNKGPSPTESEDGSGVGTKELATDEWKERPTKGGTVQAQIWRAVVFIADRRSQIIHAEGSAGNVSERSAAAKSSVDADTPNGY